MQTDVKHTIEITLVMNAEEARWLNGVMQNPLNGQHPTLEDPEDRHMRKKFFNATEAAQIK